MNYFPEFPKKKPANTGDKENCLKMIFVMKIV